MTRVPWELSLEAPVSIRAEGAWRVTRGSAEIIVAIIDEGFCLSHLRSTTAAYMAQVRASKRMAEPGHGTALAGLIAGTRAGYPGVAPGCRLLLIDLPAICTPHEEAAALHIAHSAGAAVVCCAWGMPGAPTPEVQEAVWRLSHESRSGRGGLLLFAAPNRNSQSDAWTSTTAIAVSGVTASGNPYPDFSTNVCSLRAPVTSETHMIGGEARVPEGTSGATALAAGAAALLFSARRELSAREALQLLIEKMPDGSVVDSYAAISSALRHILSRRRTLCLPTVRPAHARNHQCAVFHERRYNGGEHCYLGKLVCNVLKRRWETANANPAATFLSGAFASFTPMGITPGFTPPVQTALTSLFDAQHGLSLPARAMPAGKIPYWILIGLAADVCATPDDLITALGRRQGTITNVVDVFYREAKSTFKDEFDVPLMLLDLISTEDDVNYVALAKRNASHFAGDNLLFYLAYHHAAVTEATRCATTTDSSLAAKRLIAALHAEAFASHFLTDMFSAGHARIPRWTFLRAFKDDANRGSLMSRLLHQHEGRLGVFMTNALGQVWYAYGDTHVLHGSGVSELGSTLTPWINLRDPLEFFAHFTGGPSAQVRSELLAASVIYASLCDVFRHSAQGLSIDTSAQGRDAQAGGLLRYILDRAPYALSPDGLPVSTRSALQQRFGSLFVNMTMGSRLADRQQLLATYSGIAEDLGLTGKAVMFLAGKLYSNVTEFENEFLRGVFDNSSALRWSSYQAAHLTQHLVARTGAPVLSQLPTLLAEAYGRQLANHWILSNAAPPPAWAAAIPSLLSANLCGEHGVWHIGP